MRSKIAEILINKMSAESKIFADKYADLIVLINQILKEKQYNQKKLAEKLEKRPSEINRWLTGEHNFTLRSIAKLEAELGESLIEVPVRKLSEKFELSSGKVTIHTYRNVSDNNLERNSWIRINKPTLRLANVG